MEQFDSLEKIKNLFSQVTSEDDTNACYLVGIVNQTNNAALVGGILGGAVGGAIGAAVGSAANFSNGMVSGMDRPCAGFLLRQTNEGVGLIPLVREGIAWVNPYAKMKVCINNYFFIGNSEIEEIKIKSIQFGAAKKITIKLTNKKRIEVTSYKRDRYLSFQKECIEKFCARNGK